MSTLGPLVCADTMVLSGAVFVLPVTLEIAAAADRQRQLLDILEDQVPGAGRCPRRAAFGTVGAPVHRLVIEGNRPAPCPLVSGALGEAGGASR
ncbi:hypothetical protein ADL04_01005 [Streptomyces sp. NRRL B-3648]|nr:hypothetical protein ADL04_01005 [Streptomyces sp. NRRL B-3648]